MIFRKKDQAARLIAQARSDQKEYDALRKKFLDLVPEWNAAQRRCEEICALQQAKGFSYTRAVSEELWVARDGLVDAELKAAMVARDALTLGICGDLQTLKDRIFRRKSLVTEAFYRWVGAVCNRLPEDSSRARDLIAAGKQIEELQDLGKIVDLIVEWTGVIEDSEDTECPLLKFDLVVARALGEEAKSPVA